MVRVRDRVRVRFSLTLSLTLTHNPNPNQVWRIGLVTGNPRWQGLTWAMIPSHSSGVAACVYHLFYNSPDLQFVVLLQARVRGRGRGRVRARVRVRVSP